MFDRVKMRAEWQFAGVLAKADLWLTIAWWALILVRGALPAIFAIAIGWLIGTIDRGGSLTAPLTLVGIVFVLLQVLAPLHRAVGANLGSRTAAWLYDQLTIACVVPPGVGHLEHPRLTDDLTMARNFDLGISGPPLFVSMDFIAGEFSEVVPAALAKSRMAPAAIVSTPLCVKAPPVLNWS